ncbi:MULTISPECIES: type VII toxin-antitoxin system MntA family adenylyltransferase antitoxin [unclassified Methanoculleus]|uniref:type VII toxin-antitoxin system MntA family adenylyltransferase antitoxin n=1 Tax=unclassified Methanoculleus TaxID=2619537 RepID=UPI0025EC486A|nr:nucleotidyltransferase domain-containing protein [Methanoculleus sp. UBA377]
MRPRDLSFKEKQRLSNLLAGLLLEREEILFAYLYGSLLHGTFRDIDIGVFLRDESSGAAVSLRYETALEQELENSTGVPIDVRVLNVAPLPFAYSVLQTGEVLVSRDEQARCDFVCRIYAYLLPRFCLLPKALPEGSTWSPTRTRKSPHSRRSWCRRAGV